MSYYETLDDGLMLLNNDIEVVADEVNISMPYNFKPYPFQRKAWEAKAQGYRNFILVWHRRAGKDKTLWNMFIDFVVDEWETPGMYFYCLPTATQARKVIWDGKDNDGFPFLDHIPDCITESKTKHDMTITLINGTTIHLVGSDNYDRLVGSNPRGICFSEYAVGNPMGYEFMRPVLKANKGWALFPYTPRGKNHGWSLVQGAKKLNAKYIEKGLQPLWHVQIETIDTTTRHDGERIVSEMDIEDERDLGMSEDMIEQEYYCSFEAAIKGAIYADQIRALNADERVKYCPVDPTLPIYISADIGRTDAACWFFFQLVGDEIRIVHYYANNLQDTEHFIDYIQSWLKSTGTTLHTLILPHDARAKTMNAPISVQQKFVKVGMNAVIASPPNKVSRQEGIQQVRKIFKNFVFHNSEEVSLGLSALISYKYKYDEIAKIFSKEPLHDWASDGADAMRMFAVWFNERNPQHKRSTRRRVGNIRDGRR